MFFYFPIFSLSVFSVLRQYICICCLVLVSPFSITPQFLFALSFLTPFLAYHTCQTVDYFRFSSSSLTLFGTYRELHILLFTPPTRKLLYLAHPFFTFFSLPSIFTFTLFICSVSMFAFTLGLCPPQRLLTSFQRLDNVPEKSAFTPVSQFFSLPLPRIIFNNKCQLQESSLKDTAL